METSSLVSLLQAAWFLSTLPMVIAWFPLPGIGWLHKALLGFAKRGKILQSNKNLTVPQKFFSHFYVVGVLWTTILLVAVWFYANTTVLDNPQHLLFSSTTANKSLSSSTREYDDVYDVWLSVFMLLLMETQVLRRFYESVNVFNYSPSARMHIVGYFVGIFYYIATPLSLCCKFAPQVLDLLKNMDINVEFTANGKDHPMSISRLIIEPNYIWTMLVSPLISRLRWSAWIGAAIFLWGWLHQLRCHQILGSLRKKSGKEEEYVIPYGDWFEYVSSPHYTAEIVIYGGLVVASGGRDLSLWLLFAFVVANLGFAATITHRWYIHKFDNYPRNRRAIFPFL